jgi:hypothetical protein
MNFGAKYERAFIRPIFNTACKFNLPIQLLTAHIIRLALYFALIPNLKINSYRPYGAQFTL